MEVWPVAEVWPVVEVWPGGGMACGGCMACGGGMAGVRLTQKTHFYVIYHEIKGMFIAPTGSGLFGGVA